MIFYSLLIKINMNIVLELTCDGCGKKFSKLKTLKRHKYQDCTRLRRFYCHMCEYSSTRSGNLRRHMLKHAVPIAAPPPI